MPRGGGIAVVTIAVAIGLANLRAPGVLPLIIAALSVAAVSLIDDVRSVSWLMRLAVHSASAALVVYAIAAPRVAALEMPVFLQIPILTLTFIWIVGLTNAYNFMDGIDGIAGLQAAVAGIAWFFLLPNELAGLARVSIAIAASAFGFLFHNLPKARIFLGDVGSAFLGFSFATFGVAAASRSPSLGVAALLVVWPFVFDTIFTFFRRLRRGERLYEAHRSHIYQRLVQTGLSHVRVSLIYATLSSLGALAALFHSRGEWRLTMFFVLMALVSMPGLWFFTTGREASEPKSDKA